MKLQSTYSTLKLTLCAMLACTSIHFAIGQSKGLDGVWVWAMPARTNAPERKLIMKLKTQGEKLTGKLSFSGLDGNTIESEIQEGKVKGDEISFKVVRERNGAKSTNVYTAKLSGEMLKGKIQFSRDGEAQSRDWEAKREIEKK